MSVNLPDLVGKVVIDSAPAKASLASVSAAAKTTGQDIAKAGAEGAAGLGKIGPGALLAAGGLAAVSGAAMTLGTVLSSAARDFAKAGSELVDLNKQLGVGVVEMQKIQFAARQTGVDVGSLATSIKTMETNASKAPEKIAQLGISFGQIRSSKPEELLKLISDGLNGVSDQNERARIATEIFGKSGTQMLKMLTDDYRGLLVAAEETGLMTEQMAQKGDRLDDALSKLDKSLENVKLNLAASLASPQAISLVEMAADAVGFMAKHAMDLAHALTDSIPGLGLLVRLGELRSTFAEDGFFGTPKPGQGGYREDSGASDPFSAVTGGGSTVSTAFDAAKARRDQIKQWAKEDAAQMADHERRMVAQYAEEAKAKDQAALLTEKLAAAERTLFEQRSKHMDANPLVGSGGMFGAFWSPGKYDVTGGISMNDPKKVYNLWGDQSKFLPSEMEGNIHIGVSSADIAQKKAADSAKQWALALQGVALFAGAIGGKVGDAAQVMGNIAGSFKDWNAKDASGKDLMGKNAKIAAVSMAVGQIGGLMGGTAGSFLQGAGGGAAAGAAFGPWGAAVGGILGGIGGLFGASSAKKKELADLKSQLTGLSDEAKKFGINLDAAFASKNSSVVKAAIDQVNAAVKESEKRVAGLNTFRSGLNEYAKGGISDQAGLDRIGRYAAFSFGAQVKETGDIFGALDSIAPTLDAMAKSAKEMGFEIPKSVASLLQLNGLDDTVKSSVTGLNMMTKGIAESGLVTKDMFNDLGADAVATRAKLEEAGVGGAQAMALMQPSLQELYELQKRHGYAVDESTQKLLDEAKAQGLVGDQFMSDTAQIVDLMKILIEAVGGTLPEMYKRAGDAAEEYGRKARDAASNGIPGGTPKSRNDTGETGDGSGGPGFAAGTGGIRDFGRRSAVYLHGREAVLTEPQYDALTTAARSNAFSTFRAVDQRVSELMASRGNQGQVIHNVIHIDGKPIIEVMTNALTSGGPAAQGFRDAYAGAGR